MYSSMTYSEYYVIYVLCTSTRVLGVQVRGQSHFEIRLPSLRLNKIFHICFKIRTRSADVSTMITDVTSIVLLMLLMTMCHSFIAQPIRSSVFRARIALESSPEDVARELREQADKLRKQVASFEQEKEQAAKAERELLEKSRQEKQVVRNRYSAKVPIMKGDGSTVVERVDFPPRWPEGTSLIWTCEASLPLGIILGESEAIRGLTVVDEVVEGSNGALAGVRVGDIVRACTACRAIMKAPTWQILAGGIGMPETCRFMYNIDGRPFEEVMQAIGSNRMDPEQRPVLLVLERQDLPQPIVEC